MSSERERFAEVYRRYRAPVLAYALRRTTPETAQDVVAETFLVAWRRFSKLPREPLPWLLAVARKTLANQVRGSRRRDSLNKRLAAQPERRGAAPDEHVEAAEVLAAFRRLSPADQETLALVAWEGLTPREAAVVLGCSSVAFRARLHRARTRLERELEPTASDPPRLHERLQEGA